MSLKEDLKREFSKKRAGFGDCKPSMMYQSKFGDVTLPVLIYRVISLIFSLTIWCVFVAPNATSLKYFTNWSYTVLILYFLTASIVSFMNLPAEIRRRKAKRNAVVAPAANQKLENMDVEAKVEEVEADREEETIPWYMKIQWILYNVSLASSFLVTIIYWAVLYALVNPDTVISFFNVSVHALNIVLMMVEQYVGAIPTRIAHVYHSIIYAFIYVMFSVILYYTAGEILYPIVLDWSAPGLTTAVVFGLCFFYMVAQFVLFLIYRAIVLCVKNRK